MKRSAARFVVYTAAIIAVLVLIGLVINGSLAGLGLMVPVGAASVLMMLKRRPPAWAIGFRGHGLVFHSLATGLPVIGVEPTARRGPASCARRA